MRTAIIAVALGVLPAVWSSSVAQDQIDLSGMDCAEKALRLREIVEANEIHENEADRLEMAITNAQAECRNGDEQAFTQLAQDIETRNWNLDADVFEEN